MNRSPLDRASLRTLLIAVPAFLVAVLSGPIVGALAGDATESAVLRACYVPGSGVVYRIGGEALDEACKSPEHVEFAWNVEGPPGPPGPTGPAGPPGPGLQAGACPLGTFVTGVEPDGTLICHGTNDVRTWYLDADGDGVGGSSSVQAYEPPPGYVAASGDCDDSDPSVRPGNFDAAGDGVDADCDGFDGTRGHAVDDGDGPVCEVHPEGATTWYRDADHDGYGGTTSQTSLFDPGGEWVATRCDCDDSDSQVHPGATEIVNGKDDNCNGTAY